jgi:DNA-directed RNA polymerase subunit RPC12/RpoP
MSDEEIIEFRLPLDADGFLRRACSTCSREFKCRPTPDGEESAPAHEGGYFCPYCGVQASDDSWNTEAQSNHALQVAGARVVDPLMEGFARDMEQIGRRSGGLISVRVEREPIEEPEPLHEDNDMVRVDLDCHRGEPIKVLESWRGSVRCLICGQAPA